MALVGRRGISDVGPRSAHIAGLPYACFADRSTSCATARLALVAPRDGRPRGLRAASRRRAAASRSPRPAPRTRSAWSRTEAYPHGSREAALAAFAPLADAAPLDARGCGSPDARRRGQEGGGGRLGGGEAVQARTRRAARRARRRRRRARARRSRGALGRQRRAAPPRRGALGGRRRGLARPRRGRAQRSRGDVCAVELARTAERECIDGGAAPSSDQRRDARSTTPRT